MEEKKYLFPIKNRTKQKTELKSYNVRKDNTIVYKSNYYSLPAGTYKKQGTQVFLEINEDKISLYSLEKELIATHKLCVGKGEYIRNTDHSREKSRTLETLQTEALKLLGKTDIANDYLEKLHRHKPRYYRDNLQEIIKQTYGFEQEIINESIIICTETNQFNAFVLLKIMQSKQLEKKQTEQANLALKNIRHEQSKSLEKNAEIELSTSNINYYQKMF